jgi:hypothetical protein
MDVENDQEAWLLYKKFEGFCTPDVGRAICASILEMEREQRYTAQIPLPEQPVIVQLPKPSASDSECAEDAEKAAKCPVVCMLQPGVINKTLPVILRLPVLYTSVQPSYES